MAGIGHRGFMGRNKGGGGFSPSILNPAIWLDDADTDTITSGGAVSQWTNKVVGRPDFVQGQGSQQPSLIGNTLDFTPFDNLNSNPNSDLHGLSAQTIFIVFNADAISALSIIYGTSYAPSAYNLTNDIYVSSNSLFTSFRNTAGTNVAISTPISINTTYIACTLWDGTDLNLYLDGSFEGSTACANTGISTHNNSRIGSRSNTPSLNNYDGDTSFIIHFNYALNTTQRQQMEGWIAHKFGLTSSLPIGHPYKVTPP